MNNAIPHRRSITTMAVVTINDLDKLVCVLSLENWSNQVRWSLDLRWQDPNKPNGFHGLKVTKACQTIPVPVDRKSNSESNWCTNRIAS